MRHNYVKRSVLKHDGCVKLRLQIKGFGLGVCLVLLSTLNKKLHSSGTLPRNIFDIA